MNAASQQAAFADFLFEVKRYWMRDMFVALRDEYERLLAQDPRFDAQAAISRLRGGALYPFFSWLERHIQDEKYSGRYGLLASAEDCRSRSEESLSGNHGGRLALDPAVQVPDYYSLVDTHQHPGNLTGDTLAGLIYKASAAATQPGSTHAYALHERFAALLGEEPGTRILDAGCGFGKSSITIARRFPNSSVEGVDLAAPCLALAALEASAAQTENLTYRQADACALPHAADSFDLVTSTMLLHELPEEALNNFLAETARVLRPGGRAVHLDFRVDDPFLAFLHAEHGRRNNEPFMAAFNEMDVTGALARAGFVDATLEPFAEAEGVNTLRPEAWRFPWTVISAYKPFEQ